MKRECELGKTKTLATLLPLWLKERELQQIPQIQRNDYNHHIYAG